MKKGSVDELLHLTVPALSPFEFPHEMGCHLMAEKMGIWLAVLGEGFHHPFNFKTTGSYGRFVLGSLWPDLYSDNE